MKYLIPILIISFLSCNGQSGQEDKNIAKRVSLEEFKVLIAEEDMQLVDVRTPKEYENGFIEDALNIDFLENDFMQRCQEGLDKNKPIAIYCAGGGRSAKALNMLKEKGFKEVYELGVGYNGYR